MSFRIFAGNLAFEVTDEDLRVAFSAFGSVTYARVILDRDTGKSRGFGFVELDDAGAGNKAIEGLDGTDLKGRQLRLKEAEPREAGGGGGRRHDGPPPARRGPPRSGDPSRRPESGGEPRGFPGEEPQRRREARKPKPRPGGATDDRGRAPGGPAAAQGRPQEKVRGGAKNRFRVDDDEDEDDIDLFGKYHEEDDYDVSAIEGVEIEDEEEGTGIRIDIEPKEENEGKK